MAKGSSHEEGPQQPITLDERGAALQQTLGEALADLRAEVGAILDEVVITVPPEEVLEVCRRAREDPRLDMDYLRCLSVVDYVEYLQVVYHLFSLSHRHKVVIKTNVSPDDPVVPTVTSVYPAANWFEREGHDLFGVTFEGHPDLRPLLLYEGFEGYPGRKSFPFHDYDEW